MVNFLAGMISGLFIGWMLLPEPLWIRNLWTAMVAKITGHETVTVPIPVPVVAPTT
jgi:hypothetical protein